MTVLKHTAKLLPLSPPNKHSLRALPFNLAWPIAHSRSKAMSLPRLSRRWHHSFQHGSLGRIVFRIQLRGSTVVPWRQTKAPGPLPQLSSGSSAGINLPSRVSGGLGRGSVASSHSSPHSPTAPALEPSQLTCMTCRLSMTYPAPSAYLWTQ